MIRESARRSNVATALRFLVLLWLAAHGRAQPLPEPGAPVRADQVRSGSLLIKTDQPGVFLPAPALETEVAIRVTGIVARASVRQRFANTAGDCVEGVYVFPLPENAAVDRMRMTAGQRVIEAEIRERVEAKKIYEQAKADGKKASLLEQERPNIFTASVASIGPNETVQIEIEYQETLRFDEGKFHLRFPMVVAPRYDPGSVSPDPAVAAAAAVASAVGLRAMPDARIVPAVMRPGEPGVNPVRLQVELETGVRLRKLDSSTHTVAAAPIGDTAYSVAMAAPAAADRDFVLEWEPDLGNRPRPALFTENLDGQIYTVLVMLPPAAASVPAARLPRETIFILDTSGSMYGDSIEQARKSLFFALDRLNQEDRFNIIEFNSSMSRLWDESRRALPGSVEEAKRWVAKLQANGGTEMLPALRAALEGAGDGGEVRQVVFVTDGGVGNEEELFRYIREHLGRSRLFTVGIGSAPNSHFMTKAAEFGRGTFTYVGSPTEVEAKMGALFRKLESPVLTDVRLDWDDAAVEAWPAKIPDLYAGEPLVVAAKLSRTGGGVLVSGERAGVRWSERVPLSATAGDSGIDRLWARRKIAAL
ncbi:MAG TPA: marine proteobacterial sortase target protein, partial [Thermoanaerobaculia bacterium]|nr:marine proteobacterial sortase target protein [Thermoanaerobaculia bacterium]